MISQSTSLIRPLNGAGHIRRHAAMSAVALLTDVRRTGYSELP